MKRWIHAVDDMTNSVSPEYLKKCAAEMRRISYPENDTVMENLYYKRIDGMCRWIMMLCDEAIESGSEVDLVTIQNRIEGSLDTDRMLHYPDQIRADKALLAWFSDICSSAVS